MTIYSPFIRASLKPHRTFCALMCVCISFSEKEFLLPTQSMGLHQASALCWALDCSPLSLSLGVELGVLQECLPSTTELSVKTCMKRGSELFFNAWNWRRQLLYLATPHWRAVKNNSLWEQKPWVGQKLLILMTNSGCFLVICCMGMWHLSFHWCRCHVQLPALAPSFLLGCILFAVDEVYS